MPGYSSTRTLTCSDLTFEVADVTPEDGPLEVAVMSLTGFEPLGTFSLTLSEDQLKGTVERAVIEGVGEDVGALKFVVRSPEMVLFESPSLAELGVSDGGRTSADGVLRWGLRQNTCMLCRLRSDTTICPLGPTATAHGHANLPGSSPLPPKL